MLKEIDLEQLDGVAGGFNACGMASLPAQTRREGLLRADEAYAHAKSRGVSATQFNRMGWRAYAQSVCGRGVDRTTPRRTAPGGLEDLRL